MNVLEYDFVVFDLETTGLDASKEQIIEIGAVKIKNGKIVENFQRFISLFEYEQLPAKIIEITSITDEILQKEGQNIQVVMKEFQQFIEGTILVAQNAQFDMAFLDNYFIKQGEYANYVCIDTIDLAKELYPGEKSYSLTNLSKYFNVTYDANAHHRADYDAKLTGEIFLKGINILQKDSSLNILDEYKNIFKIQEASSKQKRFLYSLLKENEMKIYFAKSYLSSKSASRQIQILQNKKKN